jgi:hypothetical protein
MKVERYYCDFCGHPINKDLHKEDPFSSGEIVITKNNGQWSEASFDNCHKCFNKVYEFVKGLRREFKVVIEETSTNKL